MKLIRGIRLKEWLAQSLEMAATGAVCHPDPKKLLELYACLCYMGLNHIPVYIVNDLLSCFEPQKLHFQSDSGNDAPIIQRYEREFLNRIIQLLSAKGVLEISCSSADKWLFRQRLLLLILTPVSKCYPKAFVCNPAEIRDCESIEDLAGDPDLESQLHADLNSFLENLSRISWNSILNESDLFELRHLNYLNTDHLRLGCRQVIELKEMFEDIPRNLLNINDVEDEADSSFIDETHYPAGGIAGLTNKGPVENMVASEMMFLEEEVAGLNLFDMRFLENQQLFFMRDSGTLRRKRRKIHFVFDLDRLFEQKARGYDWQFSILSQGICYRLLEDFFSIFEDDAVVAELHYIAGSCSMDFINGEMNIMKLLLKDYCVHKKVSFRVYTSNALPQLEDSKRKSYALIFASDRMKRWQDFLRDYKRQLVPVYVHFSEKKNQQDALSIEGDSFDKIAELRRSLLQQLVC